MRVKFIKKPRYGMFCGVEKGEVVDIADAAIANRVIESKMAIDADKKVDSPTKTTKRKKAKKENNQP